MQLYAGTSKQFIDDTFLNRIGEKLRTRFFEEFRFQPSQSEYTSWQNSLRAMCNVLQYANLVDHGVVLEYQLPLSSRRLDCMLTGKDDNAQPNAAIVELKQWSNAAPSSIDGCVTTFVGGRRRDVLHPSNQVGQYQQYLEDCHTVFSSGQVQLSSCSYLHNIQLDPASELLSPKHESYLQQYPLFAGDQSNELAGFLESRLRKGDGQEVLGTILQTKYKASKKLLDHVAAVIQGKKEYVLLDEQLVAFNAVLAQTKSGFHDKQKAVVLIKGGPGTGKSIIALNLVAELSRLGYNTHHSTGSKAFTGNIRKILGSRASTQFTFSNQYMTTERDSIDVIILDEAHRLKKTSTNRFTPMKKKTGRSQVEELIHTGKVTVFFIDDLQSVRSEEIGSADLITKAAMAANAKLYEFELETQFRCNGSEAFVNWIDNSLGIRRTPNVLWEAKNEFDFRIVESVGDLESSIREKAANGFTARLTAGFCWKWSDPQPDGSLVSDVVIGGWSMPWNAKPDAGRLAVGIPRADNWALDPTGINQVGCIYPTQGFEFDYCGVIFGNDLRYDLTNGRWIGDLSASEDSVVKKSGDKFIDLVKSTYRVLLTRGMKGCYVYFQDKSTRDFFRSRIE